ncbi:uncharacterized protein LOC110232675 [Exaiptasia diaphana]|uniref:Myb/SANT-like DNA-binding domain-containing protein n=1 Tax=Exaiptasia diaphana TaxID=2652724 RepID=A0A913WSS1_EXADI|nr:uncharacterized protein LOC110232675 [Exaiptasia diaphana]
MDPSWPYPSTSQYYPYQFDVNYFNYHYNNGQQQRNQPDATAQSSGHINVPSQSQESNPTTAGSSEIESATTTSSNLKKYERWTHDQQQMLVQLWADRQDIINSKDNRKAWKDIAETLNKKCKTNKTSDKCIRKMKYLVDLYKAKRDWNKNQTGGPLRKSIFYDEIDEVLGCRDSVTFAHVKETDATASSNSSTSTSTANSPASTAATPGSNPDESDAEKGEKDDAKSKNESRTDRKKRRRKRRREEDDDGDLKEAIEGIAAQGERVVGSMERMLESQTQQMAMMNNFLGDFLKIVAKDNSKDK